MERKFNPGVKIIFFILIFYILSAIGSKALSQVLLDAYAETGSNAMTEGWYGNFSTEITGRSGTLWASTGGLLSFNQASQPLFSAWSVKAGNDFTIGKFPLTVNALFLWKPVSADMRETNFGWMVTHRSTHFGFALGLNTRIYSFTQTAISQYQLPDSVPTSLWEPINLMYKISWFQPLNKRWNLEASVTNYDRYFIQQETNPLLLLKAGYIFRKNLQFYAESGWMQAGLLNMQVNYFGFYLRGGVVWKIN